ncbi:MAG TPA: SRPBCC family protein [Pirellulales bacterium]|jgi:uncharacterized protein YndB with AHSA1/START domain
MSEPVPIDIRVTHRYTATAEQVFSAWLDPAQLGRWMFGRNLRDETVVRMEVDARVGGSFSFVVLRGGQEIDHVGNYLQIEPSHHLEFTWGIRANLPESSRVTIDIAPLSTGCELVLVHTIDPKWADFAASIEQSWTSMLTALASVID